jgi:hypothetical protein
MLSLEFHESYSKCYDDAFRMTETHPFCFDYCGDACAFCFCHDDVSIGL